MAHKTWLWRVAFEIVFFCSMYCCFPFFHEWSWFKKVKRKAIQGLGNIVASSNAITKISYSMELISFSLLKFLKSTAMYMKVTLALGKCLGVYGLLDITGKRLKFKYMYSNCSGFQDNGRYRCLNFRALLSVDLKNGIFLGIVTLNNKCYWSTSVKHYLYKNIRFFNKTLLGSSAEHFILKYQFYGHNQFMPTIGWDLIW